MHVFLNNDYQPTNDFTPQICPFGQRRGRKLGVVSTSSPEEQTSGDVTTMSPQIEETMNTVSRSLLKTYGWSQENRISSCVWCNVCYVCVRHVCSKSLPPLSPLELQVMVGGYNIIHSVAHPCAPFFLYRYVLFKWALLL